ncbi:MAG: response regulator [Porticoccaceae bacterium]|nr:response regulator [Porticoccaceae bacterium]
MKRTILVVEDERLSRTIIVATLESHGLKCIPAENGQQALELLTIRHCDLILTDLSMPIVDGIEFIKIVRKREKLTGKNNPIPIVVLSAEKSEIINGTRELDISGYFVKSISIDKLVPKLKYLLGEIVWENYCSKH